MPPSNVSKTTGRSALAKTKTKTRNMKAVVPDEAAATQASPKRAFETDNSLLKAVAKDKEVTPEVREAQKKAAGDAVAKTIRGDQTLGLGTGSTAKYFVDALGARVTAPKKPLTVTAGVPTSTKTADQAAGYGISLLDVKTMKKGKTIDVAVDGADQVQLVKDAKGHTEAWLIKGGGGAALLEKEVAVRAKSFVVIVDASKVVSKLGVGFPLPVMAKPAQAQRVKAELEKLGAEVTLRRKDKTDPASELFVDDVGNNVLDASFSKGIDKPYELQAKLDGMKGVAAHGLFLGMTDELVVGLSDGKTVTRRFDR